MIICGCLKGLSSCNSSSSRFMSQNGLEGYFLILQYNNIIIPMGNTCCGKSNSHAGESSFKKPKKKKGDYYDEFPGEMEETNSPNIESRQTGAEPIARGSLLCFD
ncbi:hypothetical protein FGO68_gene2558 [Halteria grandinella]|uniref:Uncharacterized protein n=1 Tax=Halteria grandinella TaxID=5974 RepID=A0A8J8P2T0_HALGN|nr:hypothetical protein FGO68_gene2558 [Halteria grandinella]